MKKILTILSVLAALWIVAVAGAGNGINPFNHTLVQGEFSSIATDTTLNGRVLRVTRTSENMQMPIADCQDRSDNDGDGLIDWPNDPGCSSSSDTDEYNAPPPPPPPPPEWDWTLMDANPADYQSSQYEECGGGLIPCFSLDAIRCKTYSFVLKPHESHFGIDFGPAFKYEGSWKICYRPYGGGITDVVYRIGDATDTYGQWEWRGNDSGYPSHIREDHRVYVRYGGGAAICIGGTQGCGPERHFRLTFTFTDTGLYGTVTRAENYL